LHGRDRVNLGCTLDRIDTMQVIQVVMIGTQALQ
jgi:hypothetical protein